MNITQITDENDRNMLLKDKEIYLGTLDYVEDTLYSLLATVDDLRNAITNEETC